MGWNLQYLVPWLSSAHLDATLSAEVHIIREAFLNAAPIATREAIKQVIPGPTQSLYAEELERAMLSTHTEVFERVIKTPFDAATARPLESIFNLPDFPSVDENMQMPLLSDWSWDDLS